MTKEFMTLLLVLAIVGDILIRSLHCNKIRELSMIYNEYL